MSTTIEKLDGGFVVTHHAIRQVASAEHVANFIVKFWPDVTAYLREYLLALPEPEPVIPPDIVNH